MDLPPLSLPGLSMMPSLQQSSSATSHSGLSQDGSASGLFGGGDWVVNMGGSGTSVQGGGTTSLLLVAAAVVVAWMLLRRKG